MNKNSLIMGGNLSTAGGYVYLVRVHTYDHDKTVGIYLSPVKHRNVVEMYARWEEMFDRRSGMTRWYKFLRAKPFTSEQWESEHRRLHVSQERETKRLYKLYTGKELEGRLFWSELFPLMMQKIYGWVPLNFEEVIIESEYG